MLINSNRFGTIEIPDNAVFKFPLGIPGFEEEKTFAFLPCDEEGPFAYMHSTVDSDLNFLLVEPFAFFRHYNIDLPEGLVKELGLSDETLPSVYSVVTVPENFEEMTANLAAPIIVNRHSREAVQVVLEKSPYSTRQRLFPFGLPKQFKKNNS